MHRGDDVPPQIHVTGASGAGVSTLGRALAGHLACATLDTDDFLWLPTPPPFRDKRAAAARREHLYAAFARSPRGWVLSGSVGD